MTAIFDFPLPLYRTCAIVFLGSYNMEDSRWTVAYLGGPLIHAPFRKKKIFHRRKKLENLVWPPFVWALVASENLAPLLKT